MARADCRFCDPLELLQGEEFERLTHRASKECPLAAGQLQLILEPSPTSADPILLAELISAGRFRHTGAGAVQRVARLIPGLPPDRRWQATLRDKGGERCAEIRLQEQRRDRPPVFELQTTNISVNEQVRQISSPTSQVQVLGHQLPLSLMVLAAAAVAAAAYGLLFPLSVLEFCLAVGALGMVALVWLIRFARSLRSHP